MLVHKAAEAARILEGDAGVEVEVLDLRTLLPLDEESLVRSVKKTGKLLVVQEDTRTGGIAGEIGMRVNERWRTSSGRLGILQSIESLIN